MYLPSTQTLTTEAKIGQMFFIGLPGPDFDSPTAKLLDDILPGGVCLFSRNIRTAEQARLLLEEIRQVSAIEPFLSLDQEGGQVDRLRRILTPMPAASKISKIEDAEQLARIIAEAVRILGFNMDFAPVVDVIDTSRSNVSNGLHSRAFGNSAEEVYELAGGFFRILQANGCIGCLKHFPGLGASEVDSHEVLPSVDVSSDQLFSIDLYPYRKLFETADVHAVMVAHAAFPQHHLQETDQNGKLLPSSLSFNIVTTLLRQQLGFEGLVLTDDLEMGAIVKNYGIGEACVIAILAGSDMVCICADANAIRDGYQAVREAIDTGRISEVRINKSLTRIAAVKSKLNAPLNFENKRLQQLSTEITELNNRLNQTYGGITF